MNCYIHFPFCASKCGYCAFYSECDASEEKFDLYLDRLRKSIISEKNLETLYVGGGTPTLPSADFLDRFITVLQEKFSFSSGAELSIEANPETVTAEKIDVLRKFFNRISLGVQSFNADLRRCIGRQCSDQALHNALELIRDAGFEHWNCDLIYSLPDESMQQWENDLHLVGGSGADHVSCYSLTPERSAALGNLFAVDDEKEAEMYAMAEDILSQYGIFRYEVSNYSRKSAECRHNINVWRGGILRGYGPSAADFDGVDRHIQVPSFLRWLDGEEPECDHISREARLNEIFAVNLRTVFGWDRQLWERVPNADAWEKRLAYAEKVAEKIPGCLQISQESIKLCPQGLMFWDSVAAELL